MLTALDASLTPAQREHMQRELTALAERLDALTEGNRETFILAGPRYRDRAGTAPAANMKKPRRPKLRRPQPTAAAEPEPAPPPDAVGDDAALRRRDWFAGDADQDAWRHPADALEVPGAASRPSMALDYFAAAGYYTELLSRVVGADGKVIAYNNPAYRKFAEDAPAKRYGNIAWRTSRADDAGRSDAARCRPSMQRCSCRLSRSVLAAEERLAGNGSGQALAQLVPALKPGGVVVVIDHVANAGDPTETVNALHRIDPAVLKRDFEAAGLTFDSESPLFANPADDHTKEVFDKAIRHKTDQVMYKFRKPG